MKKLLYAFFAMLFALGALSITGCSGDLNDYGEDGGAQTAFDWYQESPRNKAAPVPITDTEEHWWMIGETSVSAPGDSWAFTKQTSGPNEGKWVLTFKPKQLSSWGGNNLTELIFCLVGPITKANVGSWDNCNLCRYALAESGGMSGPTTPGTIEKLVKVTDSNTNLKMTGLTLKAKDDPADSNEYTCVIDDTQNPPVFVMVEGNGADGVETVLPAPTYLTATFEGKPYTKQVEKKKAEIEVTAAATTSTLYLTWKDKNYKGTITLGSEVTLSEDTTTAGSSLTGLEATKKYKISFDTTNEAAPKVTVKKIEALAIADGISYVRSNFGDKSVTWSSPDGDGTVYAVVQFATTDTDNWSSAADKTIEFGVTGSTNWDVKYTGAELTLNGDWTKLTKGGEANNKVKDTKGAESPKQDYILELKSTLTEITARIAPRYQLMICPDCVEECPAIEGQYYPTATTDGLEYTTTFKVKATTGWSAAGLPFGLVPLKDALKTGNDAGKFDFDWDNAWRNASISATSNNTEATAVNFSGHGEPNALITSGVAVGDTVTIHIKLTKTGASVTGAKCWVTK